MGSGRLSLLVVRGVVAEGGEVHVGLLCDAAGDTMANASLRRHLEGEGEGKGDGDGDGRCRGSGSAVLETMSFAYALTLISSSQW